jgi:hypothetical protein
VYDTLLFLHVLAAFLLVSTVVTFSAVALGATAGERAIAVADVFWNIGVLGTLVLGIWLALDVDGIEIWDFWILLAIVLWAFATETGRRARLDLEPAAGLGLIARATMWHWVRTVLVIALLVVMIWKPGA